MIINFDGFIPKIEEGSFIAENSSIIGKCIIEKGCSVWYYAVLRGDVNSIVIGKNSNIQDGTVVHCNYEFGVKIGQGVTIGHNATLHGCEIGDNCLIGMGSTILDGAKIGSNCIIGANSLITSGKEIPSNSLVIGSPAKAVRKLSEEEIKGINQSAKSYYDLIEIYSR